MSSDFTRDKLLRPNLKTSDGQRWDWQRSDKNRPNEIFADMFIAWTSASWARVYDPARHFDRRSPKYNHRMERYRIVESVGLYYVTFTVVEWLPVFIDETACKIIIDSFTFCITNKHLRVNSYVIMPTHLHVILFDSEFDPERLKHTLDDMRKFTGRRLLDHTARHLPKSFTQRFQENAGKDRERRFWQPSQHPVGIFSYEFWQQKVDYLHHNPCRKGLVRSPEDWRFSSARFWLIGEEGDVQLSDVGWE